MLNRTGGQQLQCRMLWVIIQETYSGLNRINRLEVFTEYLAMESDIHQALRMEDELSDCGQKSSGAVPESIDPDTHAIEHRQIKIAQRHGSV